MIPEQMREENIMNKVTYQLSTPQFVRAVIAVSLTLIICGLLALGKHVPPEMLAIFSLVVGSFFDVLPSRHTTAPVDDDIPF